MTLTFDALSTGLSAWLLAASVRAAFVGAAVWLIDGLLARRVRPPLRAALWWVVLLAAVAPALPGSPVSVWRLADPVAAIEARLGGPRIAVAESDPTAADRPSARASAVGRLLCAAWLAGALAAGAALLCRSRGVRREWLSGPGEPPPPWLAPMATDAARRLGLQRSPPLRIQRGVEAAAVCGVRRPIVVLGAELVRRGPRERVKHVLLHEFAHVRRRDPLAARIGQFAAILFWFHPLIRLARARLELLRELACDELAVAALPGGAGDYRHTLLDLARSLLAASRPAPALGFFQRHSLIMARLEHVVRPPSRRPRATRAAAGGVFLLLAACCAPGVRDAARPPPATNAAFDALHAPGCLIRRYAVMRAIADEEIARSPR